MRLDQSSSIRVENISPKEEASSLLRLFSGFIQFFSREPRTYDVATTTSTIGIRGTEFLLGAPEDAPPEVAVTTQSAVDGYNGGWMYTVDPQATATAIQLAGDEDQLADAERGRTTEQAAYLVFQTPGSVTR